ncbi:hypothetical protein XYCOK13_41660 [Xylanibacillus composti]|uniref:BIG2 domain-containing protein n=1 Tax=Xylanibacillus composti TaxID=1572762 RepID=A0A8J4H5I1_9BACL|nr:hypothetical protein XYCOK13_41660 [Xylanibacillus composti]
MPSDTVLILNTTDRNKATLTLTGDWSDGTTGVDVTAEAMWHSTNSRIATVVDGQVTALEAGTAVIKAVLGGSVIAIPVTVE